ncbi:hypothetical protein HOY80DRAFT_997026 [Tuber brumale]|nr:hypothetical protein HOY80DRAFT_997026 [Tuber brumale]
MSTNQATTILYTIRSSSAKAKIQVCLTYEFKHTTLKCWILKLTLLYAGTIILFNLRPSKLISIKTASSCVTPGLPSPISRTSINSTNNCQLSPLELRLILYLLILHWLPIYSRALSKIYYEMVSTAKFRTELNLTGRGGTVASRRYRDATFDSPHTGPFAKIHRALNSLILDVLKKAAESRRAARMNSGDVEERSVAGPSGTQPEVVVHPPPTIYAEKPFKIIYIETTAAAQVRILNDIQPLNATPDRTHQVELIDDDQVNSWVRLSNARPLTVACILHRAPAPLPDGAPGAPLVHPNTPLARRGDRYLEPGQFDVAEFYTEPASDSELEDDLAHRTKHRKGFPQSDGGWRRRIQTNDR